MLPSGNDAGAAIAVHIAGSIDKFADMMNQEAASLGATGTHFVNPHGLNDPDHYTTAYDLYLIFNEALKYPVFRQIVGTHPIRQLPRQGQPGRHQDMERRKLVHDKGAGDAGRPDRIRGKDRHYQRSRLLSHHGYQGPE